MCGIECEDVETTSWVPALPLTFLVFLHPPLLSLFRCLPVCLTAGIKDLSLNCCQRNWLSCLPRVPTPPQAPSVQALMSPAAETTASYTSWAEKTEWQWGAKVWCSWGTGSEGDGATGEQAIILTLVLRMAIQPSSRHVTNELYPALLWK